VAIAAADFAGIVNCAGPNNTYHGSLTEGGGGGCSGDDCASPVAIAGAGPHAWSNCCATTGVEGQNEGICNFFSTTGISNDLWYNWGPAPSSGSTTVSLCAGTAGLDTKLAVYDGSGCPGAAAIACNDDFCSLVSETSFNAVAGNFYTFQIGNFPGAACGTGSFTVASPAGGNECENYDDGTTENSLGFGGPGDILWMHKQGTAAGSTTVNSISTAWGTPLFGGTSAPPAGTPVRVGIWDDPNDDGNPNDLVLLQEVNALSANPNTDQFQVIPITPQVTTGIYFIGASSSGSFPAPMDENSSSAGRAWVCGDNVGTVDYNNLNGEPLPPADMDSIGFPAVFLLRGDCQGGGGCQGDECASPIAINGQGPHPFDNCCATTGAEGQNEGLCFFFSTTGIDNDLWYTWGPAGSSGTTQVSLCSGTFGLDTKLAVYDGTGCPAGAAIACNDDSCALVSSLTFNAVAGNFYTFQLGNFPGATCGQGSFEVTSLAPPGDCDTFDDGVTENSLGFGAASGTDILWMHVQGSPGGSSVVKAISSAWGTPLFGGTSAPPAGSPVRVGIWDDPNDDGNPNDLVLLQEVNTTSTNPNTDIKQVIPLSPSVQTNGVYFIGASSAGSFPAPMDENSASLGRAWVCGDNGGTVDYNNLNGEPLPPAEMDSIGFPAVFLLEGDCKDISITPMCFGDGTSVPCPCIADPVNCGFGGCTNGALGNGCGNSVNGLGANLAGSGDSIVSADTLSLTATGMKPGTLCLVIQGDAEVNKATYGDGLRCFAGNMLRLFKFTPHNGSVTVPSASSIPPNMTISARAAQLGFPIVNGNYVYQVWYRDPTRPFACSENAPVFATFNVTNGLRVLWSQ